MVQEDGKHILANDSFSSYNTQRDLPHLFSPLSKGILKQFGGR